jgi:4'-phosphopantetheinyl transferase
MNWTEPPASLTLSHDAVHLWLIDLNQSLATLVGLQLSLSPDERSRLGQFRFDRDHRRFAVRHGALRSILARYLDISPAAIEFEYGPNGKPAVLNRTNAGSIQFNLTSSGDLCLCAVSWERRVGFDVEADDGVGDAEPLIDLALSAREKGRLAALDRGKRRRVFYDCWTTKEAYIKARGVGLSLPIDTVEVLLPSGDVGLDPRLRQEGSVVGWSLWRRMVSECHHAALVADGYDLDLACFQWGGNASE